MAIRLTCPRCKVPLLVPNELANSYVRCAHCQGRVWVPKDAPADPQALERVEVEVQAAAAVPVLPGTKGPLSHRAQESKGSKSAGGGLAGSQAPGTGRSDGCPLSPKAQFPAPADPVPTGTIEPGSPSSAAPGGDRAMPIPPAPPAPGTAGASTCIPPAAPSAPSAAPPTAPSGPRVARFVAPRSDAAAIRPGADGKLPGLRLNEGQEHENQVQADSTTIHPLLLAVVICLSVVVSITLVLYDTGSPSMHSHQKNNARRIIEEKYFGSHDQNAPLEPYQLLLREAQLAHIRGDYQSEREYYGRVLDMLRAERPPGARGLTGSRSRDRELEDQIVILLSDQ